MPEISLVVHFLRLTLCLWTVSVTVAQLTTSETFSAALLASGRYDPGLGEAHSWLHGIVAKQLGSAARRRAAENRARRRLDMEPVRVEADDIAFIEALAAAGEAGDAMGLLSELPARHRALVAGPMSDYLDRLERELLAAGRRSRAHAGQPACRGRAVCKLGPCAVAAWASEPDAALGAGAHLRRPADCQP